MCSSASHNSCTGAPIEPLPVALESPSKVVTHGDREAAETARRGVLSHVVSRSSYNMATKNDSIGTRMQKLRLSENHFPRTHFPLALEEEIDMRRNGK